MHMQRSGSIVALLNQEVELFPAARPELHDPRDRSDLTQQRSPMACEQGLLGAGDRIPRQSADRLEKRRSKRVVEITRRELPRTLRQVVLDVGGELSRLQRLRSTILALRTPPHRASRTPRNVA